MTLLDLCRLIRRYWWLVVALPVVCVLACAAVVLPGSSAPSDDKDNQAVSHIVVNSQVSAVGGLASSAARQVQAENPDLTVTAKADGGTMTVTITVTGANGARGEQAANAAIANELAENVVATSEEFFADTQDSENLIAFKAQVEYAEVSEAIQNESNKGDSLKFLIVALFAGLFVAICIVVIIDMVRRPVKSIEGVQDAVELPVLEKLPVADDGERLLANVRFASKKDDLANVVVIPTSAAAGAEEAAAALEKAAKVEGADLKVTRCESLAQGMQGAYVAKDADAVVVAVHQWSDSLKALESTVAELRLADANLVGLVFGKESKKK